MEEKVHGSPDSRRSTDAEVEEGRRNAWIFTTYAIAFLVVVGVILFLTFAR
jgi:hypothetical protein